MLGRGTEAETGLRPHDLLDAALAACTLETVLQAVREQSLPITGVRVLVTHDPNAADYRMTRTIDLTGSLDSDELTSLLGLVDQSSVQRTLAGQVDVVTFAQQRNA